MRILLTGAAGFVGSHTLRRLVTESTHETAILVRPQTDLRRIVHLVPRVCVIPCDLGSPHELRPQLERFQPEAVVHLAWKGVLNSARNDADQANNVTQSLDLVRAARDAGAKHWIGFGSQAEYGPCTNRIDENQPTRPTTLYGASKLTTGRQTQQLCESLGMRFAWLRLFSSYGPYDDPSWMIPYVALKLLRGERPSTTTGEQLWDYIYVDDVASAIIATMEAEAASGVFNLGSGETVLIRTIIECLREFVNPRAEIGFGEIAYRPDQVMHLEANIERLKRATGWAPRVPLKRGLEQTVAWCRAVLNHEARAKSAA